MSNNLNLGQWGERYAIKYLENQGYEILVTNYRYSHYEIDIIAKKDPLLVFIEVKTRQTARYGFPELAVSHMKIQNIRQAAEAYIYQIDWHNDVRFDVISIVLESNEIKHFEDAFY